MIIGEIRRYLRDNNAIRVSRSLRDTAYRAICARELYLKQNQKQPSIEVINRLNQADTADLKEIVGVFTAVGEALDHA